jgi:MucB/RseB family protein
VSLHSRSHKLASGFVVLAGLAPALQQVEATHAGRLDAEMALRKLQNATGRRRIPCRGVRIIVRRAEDGTTRLKEQIYDDGRDDLGVEILSDDLTPAARLRYLTAFRFLHLNRDVRVDDWKQALENFSVALCENTREGKRAAVHLRLVPRKTVGGAVELWIDLETGFLLRVERLDDNNQPTYRMQYESLELGALERKETDPPQLPDAPEIVPISDLRFDPLEPGWRLPGFEPKEREALRVDLVSQETFLLRERYSNGIESVFVYQGLSKDMPVDPQGGPPRKESASASLTPTFFSHRFGGVAILGTEKKELWMQAIGRVPEKDLARLLDGYAESKK